MKKSLIALAVLAASGVASAQSVTVYGLVDAWVGTDKSSATGVRNTKVDSGGFSSSRWGIRGSEDLGGGLTASFQLEQGFNVDTGTTGSGGTGVNGVATASTGFTRQSWVGLSGGFGTVKVGKTWTAFDDLYGATNFSFDAAGLAATSYVLDTFNYNDRPGNTVRYEMPEMGGINAVVSYSFGENKTAAVSAGRILSGAVSYTGGPVFLGFAYQTEKTAGNVNPLKYTRLNGSYDFGVAKLLLTYGKVKQNTATDVTEYAIGADVPLSGALTLSGGYASSKEKIAATVEHTGYSITAKYDLSKRTFFYAGYERDKVKNAANAHTILAAGVQHRF